MLCTGVNLEQILKKGAENTIKTMNVDVKWGCLRGMMRRKKEWTKKRDLQSVPEVNCVAHYVIESECTNKYSAFVKKDVQETYTYYHFCEPLTEHDSDVLRTSNTWIIFKDAEGMIKPARFSRGCKGLARMAQYPAKWIRKYCKGYAHCSMYWETFLYCNMYRCTKSKGIAIWYCTRTMQ